MIMEGTLDHCERFPKVGVTVVHFYVLASLLRTSGVDITDEILFLSDFSGLSSSPSSVECCYSLSSGFSVLTSVGMIHSITRPDHTVTLSIWHSFGYLLSITLMDYFRLTTDGTQITSENETHR